MDELSLDETVAEDGRRFTVENATLYQTPKPLAASTVARVNRCTTVVDSERGAGVRAHVEDVHGSFLDETEVKSTIKSSGTGMQKVEWRKWVNPSSDESCYVTPKSTNTRPTAEENQLQKSVSLTHEALAKNLFATMSEDMTSSRKATDRDSDILDMRALLFASGKFKEAARPSASRESMMSNRSETSSLGILDLDAVSDLSGSLSPQKSVSIKSKELLKKAALKRLSDDLEMQNITAVRSSGNLRAFEVEGGSPTGDDLELTSVSHVSKSAGNMSNTDAFSNTAGSGKTLTQTFLRQAHSSPSLTSTSRRSDNHRLKSCLKKSDRKKDAHKNEKRSSGVAAEKTEKQLQFQQDSSVPAGAQYTDTPMPARQGPFALSQGSSKGHGTQSNLQGPFGQHNDMNFKEMMFGSADDLDVSVTDVQLDDQELEQFNEEFSDLGDIDNTLTDEAQSGPESREHSPDFQPLGERPEAAGERSQDLGQSYQGQLSQDLGQISQNIGPVSQDLGQRPEAAGEMSELGQRLEAAGQLSDIGQRSEAIGHSSRNQSQVSINGQTYLSPASGLDHEDMGQRSEEVGHISPHGQGTEELGQRSEAAGQISDEEDRIGVGQEDFYQKRSRPTQGAVDTRFFGSSPVVPSRGDGREDSAASQQWQRQHTLFYGDERADGDAEIDTEDEIENYMQEQRYRPGVEGVSHDDLDQQPMGRQMGEGQMSPQHGAQMGDGSSGNDSSDSGHEGSLAASAQGSQTTLDVLRTLGFASNDNFHPIPLQEERGDPPGEDYAEERHVRFASPTELRGRGTSDANVSLSDRMSGTNRESYDPLFDPTLERLSDAPDGIEQAVAGREGSDTWAYPRQRSSGGSGPGFFDPTFNGAASLPFPSDSQEESDFKLASRLLAPSADLTQRSTLSPVGQETLFPDDTQFDGLRNERPSSEGGQRAMLSPASGRLSQESDRMSLTDFLTPHAPGKDPEDIEESVVYKNEDGEFVTDLAYRNSFEEFVQHQGNPFDTFSTSGQYADSMFACQPADSAVAEGNNLPDISFDFNDEFQPASKKLSQLDADEEEFAAENQFREDEISAASLNLPDSWTIHSALYDVDTSAAYARISIGSFLGKRTEALGSLEATSNSQHERPNFGLKVETPPAERPPVVLHRPSPSDIPEYQGHSPSEVTDSDKPSNASLSLDDFDNTICADDTSREIKSASQSTDNIPSANQSRDNQSVSKSQDHISLENQSGDRISPASRSGDRISPASRSGDVLKSVSQSSQRSSDLSSSDDGINVSSVNRLISTASADMKSEDIASLILQASQSAKDRKASLKGNAKNNPPGKDLAYIKPTASNNKGQERSQGQENRSGKVPTEQKENRAPEVKAHYEQDAQYIHQTPRLSIESKRSSTRSNRSSVGSRVSTESSTLVASHNMDKRTSVESWKSDNRAPSDRDSRSSIDSRRSQPLEGKEKSRSSRIPVARSTSADRQSPARVSEGMPRQSSDRDFMTPPVRATPPSQIETWSSPPQSSHLSRSQRQAHQRELQQATPSSAVDGTIIEDHPEAEDKEYLSDQRSSGGSFSYDGESESDRDSQAGSTAEQLRQHIRDVAARNLGDSRNDSRNLYDSRNLGDNKTLGEKNLQDRDVRFGRVTPDNQQSTKSRHSSTPLNPGQAHITINTTEASISNISPYMTEAQVTINSGDNTPVISAEKATESSSGKEKYVGHEHQSTPKKRPDKKIADKKTVPRHENVSPKQVTPARHETSVDGKTDLTYQPIPSWNHSLLPDHGPDTIPAFYVSQAYTRTPFSQFSDPQASQLSQGYLSHGQLSQQFLDPKASQLGLSQGMLQSYSISPHLDHTSSTRYNSLPDPPHFGQSIPRERHYSGPSSYHDPQASHVEPPYSGQSSHHGPPHSGQSSHHGPPHSGQSSHREPPHSGQSSHRAPQYAGQASHREPQFPHHSTQPLRLGPHQNEAAQGQRSLSATAPQGILSVNAPGELCMEEVCCVGLSCQAELPIYNPTSRWLQANLSLQSVLVDGQRHNPSLLNPFHHRLKVIIEPHTTSYVKVTFAPRQPGVYIGELVINADYVSDQAYGGTRIPSHVTLQAIAEKPNIQVLADEGPMMDFGAVPWGGHRTLPLTLINHSQCGVPLRLSVSSSKSAWQCFTIERRSSITSNISRSALAPCVGNYYLPPSDKSGQIQQLQVWILFKAPSRTTAKNLWKGPPEEFTAHIQIEIDTPSSLPLLEVVTLRSLVGTARLHTPTEMDVIRFKTSVDDSCVKTLPLLNAGNIPLQLTLEVTHWPDFFSVTPSEVEIAPQSTLDVHIKFHPTHTQSRNFDSLLLMFVEPNGPGYEVTLVGEVSSRHDNKAVPSNSHVLLSNKHFLAWGGVPLGSAKSQTFELKSIAKELLLVKLHIHGNNKDFMLQNSSGVVDRYSDTKEFYIKPEQTFPVHVLYSPSRVGVASAKIQVRLPMSGVKYSVPLSGYGGTSRVVLANPSGTSEGQGSELNVGPLVVGHNIIKKVTLKNEGHRCAFIKAIAFEDEGQKKVLEEASVIVEPSSLCLLPNQWQTVAVVYQPSERQAALCSKQDNLCLSLSFICGDEISRQLYKKSLKASEKYIVSDTSPAKHMDFTAYIPNEEQVADLESIEGYRASPHDVDLFYTSLSELQLKFIAAPSYSDVPNLKTDPQMAGSHMPLSFWEDSIQSAKRASPQGSPPCKGTPIARGGGTSHTPRMLFAEQTQPQEKSLTPIHDLQYPRGPDRVLNLTDWELQPQIVKLIAPSTDGEAVVERVQMINYYERPLRYELSWPGHCITATPEQGIIPPKSHATLCLSVNSVLRSRGVTLPWSGVIHVTCDNTTKALKVQIHEEEVVSQQSSDITLPISPTEAVPLMALSTPGKPTKTQTASVAGLTFLTQCLQFPITAHGKVEELHVDLKNISDHPVKWTISSFAPPYIKEHCSQKKVQRVNYSVFWLPEKVGLLQPGQHKQVVVNFCPRSAGTFSQYWEVQCNTEASLVAMSYTSRLEFTGQATGDRSSDRSTATVSDSAVMAASFRRAEEQLVVVKNCKLMFPPTEVGMSTTCKLQVNNKDPDHPHQATVLDPDEPFSIRHHTIKMKRRCYVRLPVKFTPQRPGLHRALLFIKPDTGTTLSVTLEAEAT